QADRPGADDRDVIGVRLGHYLQILRHGSKILYSLWWGSGGGVAAPRPPPLGRFGGARVPSGCPLQTSPTVKLIGFELNHALEQLSVVSRLSSRTERMRPHYKW